MAAPINTHQDCSAELELLSRICRTVLQLAEVSTEPSFSSLGGSSIEALAVVAELSARGLSLKVVDILGTSPLREVATRIEAFGSPDEAPEE